MLPGFPSGHMTIVTFFCTFLAVAVACVALVGVARYEKNCHTLMQIVCVCMWGLAAAYGWHRLWVRLCQ